MTMPNLLGRFFDRSCSHEFSWPYQLSGGGYCQACARCGDQFVYDWETMARGEKISISVGRQHQTRLPNASMWVPRARRFIVRKPIFYHQLGHSQFHLGVLLDISESGVLLHCNPPVPQGENLEMIFVMPREITGQPNRSTLIRGEVVRSDFSELGIPVIGVALSGYRFLPK